MKKRAASAIVSLSFPLKIEDGWPPVAVECLPFRVVPRGYEALVAPLFVKNMSVDDVIHVQFDDANGQVEAWSHIARSQRSTIWLLRMHKTRTLAAALAKLRSLDCNTNSLENLGAYSVDVPASLDIEIVDRVLDKLDEDSIAVAFPSMRHAEPTGQ